MSRVKQFDEQEILTKAMELFWEKGFHATSIQDLVTHLGVNRASLYDTYGGKKELFDRALESYRAWSLSFLQEFFESYDSVRSGFRQLFIKAIDETAADPQRKGCFVVNSTTELIPGNSDLQEVLLENKSRVLELFKRYVKTGIDSGELDVGIDVAATAAALYMMYNGLRVITKVDTDRQDLYKMVDTSLKVLD